MIETGYKTENMDRDVMLEVARLNLDTYRFVTGAVPTSSPSVSPSFFTHFCADNPLAEVEALLARDKVITFPAEMLFVSRATQLLRGALSPSFACSSTEG
jgi:hypothetical protein